MSGKLKPVLSNRPEPKSPADRIMMDVIERLDRDEYDSIDSSYLRVNDVTVQEDRVLGLYFNNSDCRSKGEWMTYNYNVSVPVAELYREAHRRATHRLRDRNETAFERAYFERANPKPVTPSKPGLLARLINWVNGAPAQSPAPSGLDSSSHPQTTTEQPKNPTHTGAGT